MSDVIPFNKPTIMGNEIANIQEAILSGHSASGGPFTRRVEMILREAHEARDVLVTTSCTDALEMSAMLLDIRPGDVVIVPSYTFTSTALAFARQGATLRFCDIEPVRLGLDPADVTSVLDDRVKAIVTVHYAGVSSEVEALGVLADSVGGALIEDNAHGLFGRHQGRMLGTFGRMSTLSFHETKNVICGEGGALVLNDERDVDRAHILLDKGTNRKQYLDGLVDKYTWQGLGSSFGLSEILAAFLLAQLDEFEAISAARRHLTQTYRELLGGMAGELGVALPFEPSDAEGADHMFYVVLPQGIRSEVISRMNSEAVYPAFHYVPLHSAPAGRLFSDGYRECPVTDDISARLLRLPFYNTLTDNQIERVVDVFVRAVRGAMRS